MAAVLNELDEMYKGEATRTFTGDYMLEDWGRKEFTQGTWVEGFRLDRSTLAEINKPLKDAVYFAGEANDVNRQLGLPGAILSGFDVVDLMFRRSIRDQDISNGAQLDACLLACFVWREMSIGFCSVVPECRQNIALPTQLEPETFSLHVHNRINTFIYACI